MFRPLSIQTPADLTALSAAANLPAFDPGRLVRHGPDAHWVLLNKEGVVAGRCSLWWRSTPLLQHQRLGFIGHYAADIANTGHQLLVHACDELKAKGCTLAVGPMDGNTWRQYRFVTGGSSKPPFFLEPTNPAEWPQQFTQSGFSSLADYYSAVDEHLDEDKDAKSSRAATRMTELGIRLRTLEKARFAEELRAIYPVVTSSFANGFLYQPISEAEFVAQYEPIRQFVRPELVMIALHEDRPVGFIFTLPDLSQARTGRPIDTAIIKTLAVLPDRRFAGLGSYLVTANRRAVRALGYRRLIHALMHESNRSRSISARYAKIFRRYTLFAKAL